MGIDRYPPLVQYPLLYVERILYRIWLVSQAIPANGRRSFAKIFLEFDGVFQEAEIFINGQQAGRHVGGYTGFQADISSLVQAGDNLVAVRVNNIWKPNVAPRAGEHVFSGGIYRNVRLTKKSPVHIDWYGTFVTTPDLGRNQGKASTVRVETEICNHSDKDGEYRLVTRILSPEGKVIATVENKETLAAHSAKTVFQTTKRLRTPSLWHPEHPVLYKVISSLYKGKELLDCDETAFGFRWFEWTADQGFFLNGKHLFLKAPMYIRTRLAGVMPSPKQPCGEMSA